MTVVRKKRLKLVAEIKRNKEEIGKLRAQMTETERQRATTQKELSQLKKPEF